MTTRRNGKQYRVKGMTGVDTYIEILREEREGYRILIRSCSDATVRESEEFISFHLFDACIRTGYLYECGEPIPA
ncbi:MAG: hypothetical protein ACLFUM_09125 [Spirochaetaceae bacterium]